MKPNEKAEKKSSFFFNLFMWQVIVVFGALVVYIIYSLFV